MISKVTIINRVKYSKTLYAIYYYLGSLGVTMLKLFLKTDEKMIVFNSYGGRKYDDSPKAIYETMLVDPRFKSYKFIWAFLQPEKHNVPKAIKIKCDTIDYYKALVKARVWITNSSMTRGLDFSGKHTFFLNTWHSTTVKNIGTDVKEKSSSFASKSNKNKPDVMLAQGNYDVNMLSRVFNYPKEIFRITGFPRNDSLVNVTDEQRISIREKLRIPAGKKVILYAPTFREYEKDNWGNCIMSIPINFIKWREMLGNNYVLFLRAHYEVVKVLQLNDNDFVRNVSDYPELNDLMIAADILVSDYSSIFVDYSLLGRPMLCFAYDYDLYQQKRGLCIDIRKELSSYITNEDTLINEIVNLNENYRRKIAKAFCAKYIERCGDAAQSSVNLIYDALSK